MLARFLPTPGTLRSGLLVGSVLSLFLLTACSTGSATPADPAPTTPANPPSPIATIAAPVTPAPPTITRPLATATTGPSTPPPTATATSANPTAVPTLGPSATAAAAAPTVAPTPVPSATALSANSAPTASATQEEVKIYLIALADGKAMGPVGCGDQAVAVTRTVPSTRAPLTAALRELLAIKDREYGQSGLYNALYQSNLQVEKVTIEGGKATIQLTGQLRLGGVCDNPRVTAQLEQTALQFNTVKEADIRINGKPLDQVLSLR